MAQRLSKDTNVTYTYTFSEYENSLLVSILLSVNDLKELPQETKDTIWDLLKVLCEDEFDSFK